jgi:glycosyltransferase involved in cell wall biosynthesis
MSKEEPLVSIIMNCYNGDSFLRDAINSIYSQTYKNWEIIFWDNASSDNSSKIAKSYDSKLRYYRASHTTPLGEARVFATEKAAGDYLAFLDVDDLWHKSKLEKQLKLFFESVYAFVYCGTEVIFDDEDKNHIYKQGEILKSGNIFNDLAKENFITFSSVIVDKSRFFQCGGFPNHFKNSTDYWVFLRLSQKFSVGVVQDVLCKYRVHNNNLSSMQNVIGAEESIEILTSFLPDRIAIEGLRYQYVQLTIAYIKEKRFVSALMLLLEKGGWRLLVSRLLSKLMFKFIH